MKIKTATVIMALAVGSAFASPSYQTINVPGALYTEVEGINNNGQAVGLYVTATCTCGFIYNISTQNFTLLTGAAYAINDTGTVGGAGYTYSNGTYTTIGETVSGINDSGQLAFTDTSGMFNEAVRETPNGHGGYTESTLSIGAYGTDSGGLNNLGQMVGYYQNPFEDAFIWNSNGSYSTFNVPNDQNTTEAHGINDNGVIVGDYYDFNLGHVGGFIDENGKFVTDINAPGSNYTYVTDINDQGTIVGWYQTPGGLSQGFILTGELPEPGTIGLSLIGLGAILGLARRRQLR